MGKCVPSQARPAALEVPQPGCESASRAPHSRHLHLDHMYIQKYRVSGESEILPPRLG